jgi:hypothetical protein
VFLSDGTTLVDGTNWVLHATGTTYGRCPDGTGAFFTGVAVTKGAANSCISPVPQTWPGSASVTTVDPAGALGSDVSGLAYEGTGTRTRGVLWAVDNSGSLMLRLVWDGAQWVRDTANGWSAGKTLRFPGGVGLPDSEGVALTDAGSAGGVFVSSERNLSAGAVSRNSVLRYDVSGAAASLTATQEWDLTAALPATGANTGAESVEWVPDSYLVGAGFVDENTDEPYDPADYPGHGDGLFFVGLELDGSVHVFALDQNSSSFTRVAGFASGFSTFGALHFDRDENQVWVACDNNCDVRSRVFEIDSQGGFANVADYTRPAGMDNQNNEGFTITPDSECVAGSKPVYWADDGNTGGHVLRAGTIPCTPPPPPIGSAGWSANTAAKGDFNGDGFGDLAIGVRENNAQGAVHVLLGSATGVVAAGSQLWSQDSVGIADDAEDGDDFGRSLAVGDFNGDGFADLAIGAPGENDGEGAVHVLYGSVGGLSATGSQLFTQASAGIGDSPEPGDRFGATLAAGNVNSSSAADELVVGAPDEDIGAVTDAGIVHVLKGGPAGLTGGTNFVWSQNSSGVADSAEPGDRFGASLAIGNLGGSTVVDLAVGVPEEDVGALTDAGIVHVLKGSAAGASATGSSLWSQNSAGVGDTAEESDGFGAALAIGNIGGTNIDDLIVGVPGEDIGAAENAGVVQAIRGAGAGPTGAASQTFSQATAGIADSPQTGDELGYAVAVGDFGGDDYLDLAVGAPGESLVNPHYGIVHLIPGSSTGLTATGAQFWTQNSAGVGDVAEANDRFGAALASSDFGNTSDWDLAIGAPSESSGALSSTGIVHVLPGSDTFFTGTGSKTFGQNTAGVADSAEALDAMGIALGR